MLSKPCGPILFRAIPRGRFLVVGPEVGQGFFFTEHFSFPWIQLFGKQISDHVTEWLKRLLSRRSKTTSRAASASARHALSGLDPGTEQAFEDPSRWRSGFSIESVRSAIRDYLDHYRHDVVRIWGAGH